MTRIAIALAFAAGCSGGGEPVDTDSAGAQTVSPGPPRSLFGRVHDVNDDTIGLVGVEVRAGDVVVTSDLTGQYRLTAPTPLPTLSVDARDLGFAPAVFHLPDYGDALEVWPGLLPLDQTEQALAVMSGTAPISPVLREDRGYLVVQVRFITSLEGHPEGAEVRVSAGGEPVPDLYVFAYNEALDTCLPARVEGGVAISDVRCDGIVLVPEAPTDADVTVDMFHPTRDCARSAEQRLAGLGSSTISAVLRLVPGALNVTGMECKWLGEEP